MAVPQTVDVDIDQILVIVKRDQNSIGLWAPADWKKYGTVKFVNPNINVTISDRYPGPELKSMEMVPVSYSKLNYQHTIELIDTLVEDKVIFARTLSNLKSASALKITDINAYKQILLPFYGHLQAVTLTWLHNVKLIRTGKYNTNYVTTGDLEQDLVKLLKQEFNQLEHQVYGELPTDGDKIDIGIKMINLLSEDIMTHPLLPEFFEITFGSAELCAMVISLTQITGGIRPDQSAIETAVNYLSKEESRVILTTEQQINGDEIFIFPYVDAISTSNGLIYSIDDHRNALDKYLGFDPNELDLSQSYLTGSILPATICPPINSITTKPEVIINALYPSKYTVTEHGDNYNHYRYQDAMKDMISSGNLSAYQRDGDQLTLNQVKFQIVNGADIDLAIDALDDRELDVIANKHYQRIKQRFPDAKLVRTLPYINKYRITGIPREIEMYKSDRRHILTHHVPMTRGWITGNGNERQTYLSASCLYSYLTHRITNYYYFAGKVSPAEILLKYEQRGFTIDIPEVDELIKSYKRQVNKWRHPMPVLYQIVERIGTNQDDVVGKNKQLNTPS